MTLAVATILIVRNHDTILLHPYGVANLNRRLLFHRDRINSTCGAYLRTLVTLGTAVTLLVRHRRLHKRLQVSRRTQNLRRTYGYTQLTARAVLCEVAETA